MRAADSRGNLEKQPTVKGTSTKGRDMARTHNYWLTKRTYGMPPGYERIQWRHKESE